MPPPALRSTLFRRGGEHDAAEAGHAARDHEDDDPDAGDVDARAARRLGVAADGVDVPAEGRALGDERPEEQHHDDEEQRERHTAVLVADRDGDERDRDDADQLDGDERRVADGDAVTAAREHAAQAC